MDEPAPITPLSTTERRVLGVLVEKAKTTPEAYPLSLNALATGCNQKSNRDPLMSLVDEQVEATLTEMQQRGLVTRITGGRVERWRHNLYDVWSVDKVELAILAELLLRGAQTEGELRTRASRMEPIESIELLRQKLKPLVERKLVVFLGEEGRRGTQLTHGFHTPAELERLRLAGPKIEASPAPSSSATVRDELHQDVAQLKQQMSELQDAMRAVQDEVRQLKASLGA